MSKYAVFLVMQIGVGLSWEFDPVAPGLWVMQFRAGGHAYVFLCYGTNVMLNVVAGKDGVGAAVLIRACSPVAGVCSLQCFHSLPADQCFDGFRGLREKQKKTQFSEFPSCIPIEFPYGRRALREKLVMGRWKGTRQQFTFSFLVIVTHGAISLGISISISSLKYPV